jgi:hypothetical protein
MALVSLYQAKTHLRYTGNANDEDLQDHLDQAEAQILDYIGSTQHWRDVAAAWTEATVPKFVQAAILLQCGELDRYRGDDQAGEGPIREGAEDLSPQVRELLRRTRDPVLA